MPQIMIEERMMRPDQGDAADARGQEGLEARRKGRVRMDEVGLEPAERPQREAHGKRRLESQVDRQPKRREGGHAILPARRLLQLRTALGGHGEDAHAVALEIGVLRGLQQLD